MNNEPSPKIKAQRKYSTKVKKFSVNFKNEEMEEINALLKKHNIQKKQLVVDAINKLKLK